MQTYSVVFTPEAQDQLVAIYSYIAEAGAPLNAQRYTDAIVTYCEGLAHFPQRGTRRDDIRAGLRITNYEGRAVIAFAVNETALQVAVIGVYYGGQDYESALQPSL